MPVKLKQFYTEGGGNLRVMSLLFISLAAAACQVTVKFPYLSDSENMTNTDVLAIF